jgi:predicted GIY-YIG superfamily endonuclease
MAGYYCYHYYVGNVKKHSGITTDPQRRQTEHQQRWPGGKLYPVMGPVTEAAARAWEALQTKTITPERR